MTSEDLDLLNALPVPAAFALAGRSALRVLPLTREAIHKQEWADDPLSHVARLALAILSACLRSQNVSSESFPLAARAMLHTASITAGGPARGACAVAAIAAGAHVDIGAYPYGSMARGLAETLSGGVDGGHIPEHHIQALREDLSYLSQEGVAASVWVQPCWPDSKGSEPADWTAALDRWCQEVGDLQASAPAKAQSIPAVINGLARAILIGSKTGAYCFDSWILHYASKFHGQGTSFASSLPSYGDVWTGIVAPKKSEKEQPTTDEQPPESIRLSRGSGTSLADEATSQDRLGRSNLADAIAEMLADPNQGTRFTFGLIGDWGTGKSSVLEMVRQRLLSRRKPGRFFVANFNAWKYQGTDSLSAGLAQEVAQALTKNPLRKIVQLSLYAFHEKPLSASVTLALALVLAALGIVAAHFIGGVVPLPDLLRDLLKAPEYTVATLGTRLAGSAAGIGLLVAAVTTVWRFYLAHLAYPFDSRLSAFLKMPDYGQHLGQIPIIQRQIDTLWKITRRWPFAKKTDRLVVMVDDLDRCDLENINKILDAIRLVMDIEGVITIVALDHRIAFRAVAKRFRQLSGSEQSGDDIARLFLGKIIQVPIRLDEPNDEGVSRYVHEVLFAEPPSTVTARPAIGMRRFYPWVFPRSREPAPPRPSSDSVPVVEQPSQGGQHDGTTNDGDSVRAARISSVHPKEREWFRRFAAGFSFRNPRLLLRMRNSYRFLRRLRFASEDTISDNALEQLRSMMLMLFWQEFLHQRGRETRVKCVAWLWGVTKDGPKGTAEADVLTSSLHKEMREAFAMNGEGDSYTALARPVRQVVMPHGEEGVPDSKQETIAWNKRLERADPPR